MAEVHFTAEEKSKAVKKESVVQSEIQLWTALGSKILAFGFGDHPGRERMSRDNLSSITHLKYARSGQVHRPAAEI